MDQKNTSDFRRIKRYACYAGLLISILFFFLFYSPHATIFSPRSSILFGLIYGALLGLATFFILLFVYGFLTKQIIKVKRPAVNFVAKTHTSTPMEFHDSNRLEWYNDVTNPLNPIFQSNERSLRND